MAPSWCSIKIFSFFQIVETVKKVYHSVINKQSSASYNLDKSQGKINDIILSISLLQNKPKSIILSLLKTIFLHYYILFCGRKFNCKITAANFSSANLLLAPVVLFWNYKFLPKAKNFRLFYHVTRFDHSEARRSPPNPAFIFWSRTVPKPVFQGKLKNP